MEVGISSQQGWRKTQEDAHVSAQLGDNKLLFGVFDGHGGPEVSKFCSEYIHVEICKLPEYQRGDFGDSLTAVFHRMDDMMRTPEGLKALNSFKESPSGT